MTFLKRSKLQQNDEKQIQYGDLNVLHQHAFGLQEGYYTRYSQQASSSGLPCTQSNLLSSNPSKHQLDYQENPDVEPSFTSAVAYPHIDNHIQQHSRALGDGPTPFDIVASRLDAMITSIDGEQFSGDDRELVPPFIKLRGGSAEDSRALTQGVVNDSTTDLSNANHFSKVLLYANSRLPFQLQPLKLYMPTYPLICLAAQYSYHVYSKPTGAERDTHVDADWRHRTKAMVIKSVPIDDMNVIVFAIRGSQTFMDWAVNFNTSPSAPEGFLDDPGNLCHSGFLSVARKMVKPVASRLMALLQENPLRSKCSLLMTGHSAGGAVATLLYAHMLSHTVNSELSNLTGYFKRVHCITFGSPPLSLLPIQKPSTPNLRKSVFLSFINEGDPVPRADRAYVRSLLDLYTSPAPGATTLSMLIPKSTRSKDASVPTAIWSVPPCTLSNAGRLIILRTLGSEDVVQAGVTHDEQLRGVVFGEPMMHQMRVYMRRVEVLATNAVTVKMW